MRNNIYFKINYLQVKLTSVGNNINRTLLLIKVVNFGVISVDSSVENRRYVFL